MGFILSRVIYLTIFILMALLVIFSFLNSRKNSKIIIKNFLRLEKKDEKLKDKGNF